jgi:hypothetical protein
MTRREDGPRIVATMMWEAPGLVLRGGFAYLRIKRQAKRSSRHFMRGLVRGGMSPEVARSLSQKYATRLSIRRFIGGLGSHRHSVRER